ncbi:MAG: tRNA (pseudouridine(54)-N(1))-methyltransferase TrmY [Halobacteriaceae archaeon]
MREFVVIGHAAPTDPDFSLDALPGAGRIDVLCRSIAAALLTSHGIREATRIHLVIQDRITITVDGGEVRNLQPDERSIAGLLRTALDAADDAVGHQPAEPAPGLAIRRRGLEATLEACARRGQVIGLHEDGVPLTDVDPPEHPVVVLSDHRDRTDREADLLTTVGAEDVRIGPTVVHTDHGIAVIGNWLDTAGYTRY